MIKRLFVSRNLSSDSPIKSLAARFNLKLIDKSLIHFSPISFEPPTDDWIFFYSKAGVKYFFASPSVSGKSYKIICYGAATSAFCNNYADVTAFANATPQDALILINRLTNGDPVHFISGKNSLRSVQKILSSDTYYETIVYDNHPKKGLKLSSYDYAVLTSPINVRAFFDGGGRATEYIAIGNTTAAAITGPDQNITIAQYPSEQGIAHALEMLLKK